MAAKKTTKSITIPLPSGGNLQILLVILLVGAAFAVGSLWTKVQQLEKGQGGTGKVAVAPGDVADPSVPSATADSVPPVADDDWVKGDRSARIALIEYSDLECPFCSRFHPTAQQAVDDYDGQLMWVYRHYPLSNIHPSAQKAAEATECAGKLGGNDAFWALVDEIFETGTLDKDGMADLAVGAGVSRASFVSCLDSGETEDLVASDLQSGLDSGVTGTPGNILLDTKTGKTQVLRGAVPIDQVKLAVDQLLSE